jgi:hypothetical protein
MQAGSRDGRGKEMQSDPIAVARASYIAYANKDRAAIDALIADDFHFTSPLDNRLNRATYFERCWPNSRMPRNLDVGPLLLKNRGVTIDPEMCPPYFMASRLSVIDAFFIGHARRNPSKRFHYLIYAARQSCERLPAGYFVNQGISMLSMDN